MRLEIAVGFYEGDLKVWDTEYIEVPVSFDRGDRDEILRQIMGQHPQWSKDTIAFVACLGEADADEDDDN